MKVFSSFLALAFVLCAQAATNESSRLSPIVVEAPAISIQQTPASVTALPSPSETGARTLYDLTSYAPNLHLTPSPSRAFGDIQTLRGVGNTQFFSSPALAMYVDDVPMGSVMTYPMDLLQAERIELWRGPHGTMFGQNNEAGVLNITSRRAGNRFEAFADASYGTYNEQVYRAGVMGPIIKDKLFYAIAGAFSHLDGFLDNPTLGTHPDKQESWNGRFSLVWTPTTDWDISLTLAGEKRHDGGRVVPLVGNLFQSPALTDSYAESDSNTEALRIARTFDKFSITSITTRRGYNLEPLFLDFRDLSYMVTPSTIQITQDYERWTQELRLQSLDAGPWQWRAGFFFATSRQEGNDTRTYYIPGPFPRTTHFNLDEDNYALFGQLTYAGIEKLAVTLGMRLDYTVRGIDRRETFSMPLHAEKGMFNAAPKLSLSYQLATNLVAYASTGLGFKPGGYSAYMAPPTSSEFSTERNWANELGLKSTWLDGKLLANLALFYNLIHDYQVEMIDVTGNLNVYNADRVTTYGAELELIAKPVAGLELSGSLGYTHAEFDRFTSPVSGANLDGRRPPYVPDLTATVAAQYRCPGGFFSRIEMQGTGQTYYDEANTSFFSESSYYLLNARIGYEARYWGVYLFGRNLADTEYYARKITGPPAGIPGDPRTLGVMLSARY